MEHRSQAKAFRDGKADMSFLKGEVPMASVSALQTILSLVPWTTAIITAASMENQS